MLSTIVGDVTVRALSVRTACPVCTSQESEVLVDLPYDDRELRDYLGRYYTSQGHPNLEHLNGERYRLLACRNCTFIYQERVPTDEFAMELYETWIDPSVVSATMSGADVGRRQFREIRSLKRMIHMVGKPSREIKVLDIGMGWGDWLFAARALGCQPYGLELSPARVANAKRNGIAVVSWEDLPTEFFDIVNCDQVLEHLSEPRNALDSMRKCLAPNGVMRVSVPDVSPLLGRLRSGKGVDWRGERHTRSRPNHTETVTPLEHVNSFTGRTLRAILRNCGLREVDYSVANLLSTAALDNDSFKDVLKGLLTLVGLRERFTTALVTRS